MSLINCTTSESLLLGMFCSVKIALNKAFTLSFISLPVSQAGISCMYIKIYQEWHVIWKIFMLEFGRVM